MQAADILSLMIPVTYFVFLGTESCGRREPFRRAAAGSGWA